MSKKGFASLPPEKLREISRKGGMSVRPENRSFSKNRELATQAGRKGGMAVTKEKRSFSTNRALASEAGRKGAMSPRA